MNIRRTMSLALLAAAALTGMASQGAHATTTTPTAQHSITGTDTASADNRVNVEILR